MRRLFIRSGAFLLCAVALPVAHPLAAQVGVPGGGGGSAPAHLARYYGYMLEKVFEIIEPYIDRDFFSVSEAQLIQTGADH